MKPAYEAAISEGGEDSKTKFREYHHAHRYDDEVRRANAGKRGEIMSEMAKRLAHFVCLLHLLRKD